MKSNAASASASAKVSRERERETDRQTENGQREIVVKLSTCCRS